MNKKALHFIDWAISLGIFLIAIIAIFVYIKPGAKPEYEGTTLASLIEENFIESTSMIVKQTPIFIRLITQDYPSSTGLKTTTIDILIVGEYNYGNMQPDPRKELPRKIKATTDRKNLHLECNAIECKDLSYVLSYFPVPQTLSQHTQTARLQLDCTPEDRNYCFAELGSTIDIKGISTRKAKELTTIDYNELKQKWKFPQNRDFAIYAYTADSTYISIQKGPEPPANVNVFVKETKYWAVNSEGIITPLTINVRVW